MADKPELFLGIDGCKAGWFVVKLNVDQSIQMDIIPNFASIASLVQANHRILIDIPIGLPHREKRLCEFEARKKLSPHRSSSVFPIPSRTSLYASSYEEACHVNLELMGNKLSKQTWNIRDKITEVDQWMRHNPSSIGIVRECHPEVAFWAMDGQSPMIHSKKTAEGREARLKVIQKYLPDAETQHEYALKKWPRKFLASDDILDAMILAVSGQFPLASLPVHPQIDSEGLPMEIVYALPPDGNRA
ncbi:MAG: DUF429 domain-containing protein [Bacteroidia bacterium]|nr:DUF429 domain-containing protein [Bacteroidia bacterium]